MSWDAYEKMRELDIMSRLGASWYASVHAGTIRLADVPPEHRDFVYAKITHTNAPPPKE